MHDKPTIPDINTALSKQDTAGGNIHPLRYLSEDEFAELGSENTVFVRSITARELSLFLPEAKTMPGDVQFQMIMGADGVPILVTDSQSALSEWFEHNEFSQAQRH